MTESNYTYCAILIYIIIMISLVMIKPQFLYDHNKKQYKGLGSIEGKTMLSLPVLSVVIAIIIGLIFCNIGQNTECNNTEKIIRYEYVKVPYYYQVQK